MQENQVVHIKKVNGIVCLLFHSNYHDCGRGVILNKPENENNHSTAMQVLFPFFLVSDTNTYMLASQSFIYFNRKSFKKNDFIRCR